MAGNKWISVKDALPKIATQCDFVVELSGDRKILRGCYSGTESAYGHKWKGFVGHYYSFCVFGDKHIFASVIVALPEDAVVTHWRAVDDELPRRRVINDGH